MRLLEQAVRLEPDNARYAYVYAVGLSSPAEPTSWVRSGRRWQTRDRLPPLGRR